MKKVTVNEAVAAIQSADSKEVMQAILEQCTKSVMIQVYEAVTGQPESFKASLKKAELAENVAYRIQVWRENEEFKAKSFDEKYEILTTCPNHCDRITYAYKFTAEELQATVLRLGIPARYDDGDELDPWAKDILTYDVIKELKAREDMATIDELMNGDDAVALKEELNRTHPDTLRRLLAKYGVSCEDDRTIYGMKMVNALYEYYLSGIQSVPEDDVEANIIEDAASYLMEHAELEESLLTDDERRHNEQVIAEAHARVELAAEYEEDAAIWSRQELEDIAVELGVEDFDWMSNSELIASIVMKDACMYDGLLAEKEHMMLEERLTTEAQAEAEAIQSLREAEQWEGLTAVAKDNDIELTTMQEISKPEQVSQPALMVEYEPDFDEGTYTPDYEDKLAVLDGIPAAHEPDIWRPASKQEVIQEVEGVYKPEPEYLITTCTAPAIMLGIGLIGSVVLPLILAPLPLYFIALLCCMCALPYAVMGDTEPSRFARVELKRVSPPPIPVSYKDCNRSDTSIETLLDKAYTKYLTLLTEYRKGRAVA